MYVIGNVINSTRKVNLPFFRGICKKAYLNIKQNFKWMNIANDLHVILGHVCDHIEWNDGYGLGDLSEVHTNFSVFINSQIYVQSQCETFRIFCHSDFM